MVMGRSRGISPMTCTTKRAGRKTLMAKYEVTITLANSAPFFKKAAISA